MTIVAPTKHPSLDGSKLLVVRSLEPAMQPDVLAVDAVGAGVGDQVIVATGSHAVAVAAGGAAVDAVIVAIVEPPVAPPRAAAQATATAPDRVLRRPQTPEGKAHG